MRGDITRQDVEAVVTAANTKLRGGDGVDGAVHAAARPRLLQASLALAPCPPGGAVLECRAFPVVHEPELPSWLRQELRSAKSLTAFTGTSTKTGSHCIALPAVERSAHPRGHHPVPR